MDKIESGLMECVLIHGKTIHDGFVAIPAQAFRIAYDYEKEIQCGGSVCQSLNMAVTNNPVIDPTELRGDPADAVC